MAQPRQQESSTPELREFVASASTAPGRFSGKKRPRQRTATASRTERTPGQLRDDQVALFDLLNLLSHQFRTPLQAIFGYTELLEREIHGPLTDAQRRDVRAIQQSQQQLLGLINTLEAPRQK